MDEHGAAAFLSDAGPRLGSSLDLAVTLDALTKVSIPYLGDVCIVDEVRHGELRRLAAAASDPAIEELVGAQPSLYRITAGDPLARVIDSGRAEIVEGAGGLIFGPEPPPGLKGDSLIAPLLVRGRTIGAVAFAALDGRRRYGPEDLKTAEDLAHRAALALDNARLYEHVVGLVNTLQQALLPEQLPSVDGLELAARFRPAGDGSVIGGDFYDVLPRDDGVDLVIGDVTGKGAQAAALTGLVRHTLRTAARYEARPRDVLATVNRALLEERGGAGGSYCTVALCRVSLARSARATLCCAGHPMPMVVRADGEVEPVGRHGSVLGWVPDPDLHEVEFALGAGEALVLYTDGVTEARTTGEAYGSAGLDQLLRAAAGQDADGIAARVDRAAARAGERRDDVAVLVGRVRP
jgi:serine phosphatase RsbU (regulator of sigma subunit)